VAEDGKGRDCDAVDEPTIGLTTDWETYARLATGRIDPDAPDVRASITLTGDRSLAARLPQALAITP